MSFASQLREHGSLLLLTKSRRAPMIQWRSQATILSEPAQITALDCLHPAILPPSPHSLTFTQTHIPNYYQTMISPLATILQQVAVVANQFIIRDIDPSSSDFLYSSNLWSVAERNGFYDVERDGPYLDFLKTYAPQRAHSPYVTR